jgi:polyferredoxin
MERIGKPRGLIDYMALSDEPMERAGGSPRPIWQHVLRPRTLMYTTLWSLVGIGLVYALFIQADIDMTVAPVRNPTYVTMSDGSIRNTYDVRLLNKHGEDRPFQLSLVSEDTLQIELEGTSEHTVIVPANQTKLQRVYVVAKPESEAAHRDRTSFRFWIEDTINGDRAYTDTVFNGKEN